MSALPLFLDRKFTGFEVGLISAQFCYEFKQECTFNKSFIFELIRDP